MTEYLPVVGMECHAELLTESKMFCGCPNEFGGEPNTRCCPVCLGMPGSLPVINKLAVEFVIKASLALNCSITPNAKFDRKNYYYPDLPKGYQISEYDLPIGINGWLDIEVGDVQKRIHIRRVHLEEDTGKLTHAMGNDSLVDLNRSGVPLMEIVTEFPPDIQSSEEAKAYLTKLRAILTYIGVCDGKMEEGSLRCEPNVSVKAVGSDTYGTKSEIKNLNSFRTVQRGIDFEVARQANLLNTGQQVKQETRGWNEAKQETFSQRSKEVEQEYRYFPEPDLVPLSITSEWIAQVQSTMPELPDVRRDRFVTEYGIPNYDATLLTDSILLADYFETATKTCGDAKSAANWMMGDLSKLVNADNRQVYESPVTGIKLAGLISLINEGTISGKIAKMVLEDMYASGRSAIEIVDEKGLRSIKDTGALQAMVEKVFAENDAVVQEIVVEGKAQKRGFLVGQMMKASQGKGDPKEINRLIDEKLLSLSNPV